MQVELFGKCLGNSSSKTAVVSNCYNTGNIRTTSSSNSGCNGGIVGDASYKCKINNCINYGNVSGYRCIGGIIGICQIQKSDLSRCYNSGNITASNFNAGGIIGCFNGCTHTAYNCFTKSGTQIKCSSTTASYDATNNGNNPGYIIAAYDGSNYNCVFKNNGNTCTSSTTYGLTSALPSTFSIVTGTNGELNSGTSSDVWEYDTENLNAPKLKWEK